MSGLEDSLDMAEEAHKLKKPEVLDAERKRQKEFNELLRSRSAEQPRYRRAEQPGEVISGIMPWYAIPLMLIFGLGTATIGVIVVPSIYLLIYSIIFAPTSSYTSSYPSASQMMRPIFHIFLIFLIGSGLGFVIGMGVAKGAEIAKNRNNSLRGIIGFISGIYSVIMLPLMQNGDFFTLGLLVLAIVIFSTVGTQTEKY